MNFSNINWTSLLIPAIVGMAGVLAHLLKQAQVGGEGRDAFKAYLHGHFNSIALTWIGFGATFVALYQSESLNMFSAFSAGYMADSIFGKISAPKTPGE